MRIFLVPPNLLFNGSRYYFLGTVGLQRHDDKSCPYSGEVKNEWSYTPAPPICLCGVDRVDNLYVSYFNSSINVCSVERNRRRSHMGVGKDLVMSSDDSEKRRRQPQ